MLAFSTWRPPVWGAALEFGQLKIGLCAPIAVHYAQNCLLSPLINSTHGPAHAELEALLPTCTPHFLATQFSRWVLGPLIILPPCVAAGSWCVNTARASSPASQPHCSAFTKVAVPESNLFCWIRSRV